MKRLCMLLLTISFLCSGLCVSAQGVTSVGGDVTIDCTFDGLKQGAPVLIVILPEIKDSQGEDVTLQNLPAQTVTADMLAELKQKTEYFEVVTADENGKVVLSCKMKPQLVTGDVHVYAKYMGEPDWVKLGEFEHVSQNDIDYIVALFNNDISGYKAAIDGDLSAGNILKKSSADTAYYETLKVTAETSKDYTDDFCEVLFSKRPENGFDLNSLVNCFNETAAWIKLREQDDTLQIINDYNAKYWNLPVSEENFAGLSTAEKAKILTAVKKGKYSTAALLEKGFETELVLALFREATEREKLSNLTENGNFSAYFVDVQTMLSEAKIDEYKKLNVYNYVLERNKNCTTFEEVRRLFEDGIKSLKKTPSSSGGGSSGGRQVSNTTGVGRVTPDNTTVSDTEKTLPFVDVSADRWAYGYVQRLYQNNIINGVSDTEFAPERFIKRKEFVKIMIGVLNMEPSLSDSVFDDLQTGCYWEPYIMAAYENGLINGISEKTFGMSFNISRQDAAVIISRLLKNTEGAEIVFNDGSDIADYARNAVGIAVASGVFSGDDSGNFNPKQSLSRSEACAILCRLADRLKGV